MHYSSGEETAVCSWYVSCRRVEILLLHFELNVVVKNAVHILENVRINVHLAVCRLLLVFNVLQKLQTTLGKHKELSKNINGREHRHVINKPYVGCLNAEVVISGDEHFYTINA